MYIKVLWKRCYSLHLCLTMIVKRIGNSEIKNIYNVKKEKCIVLSYDLTYGENVTFIF